MAEGLLRAMLGDGYEAYSAGIISSYVDPRAIKVMIEIGIDISSQRSKTAQEFQDNIFDLAVTVCDRAKQACPIVSTEHEGSPPKARMVIHHSFRDPAQASRSEEQQLSAFRKDQGRDKGIDLQKFLIIRTILPMK